MSLRPIDLTTALRPSLLPDEVLLFVQDAVGLYNGKSKIAEYQNGQAYLTSHRACYVDYEQPRQRAVAVELKDVERCDVYGRFLKSSPKVTLYPKAAKYAPVATRASSGASTPNQLHSPRAASPRGPIGKPANPPVVNATWVCPICSFSNQVPPNFDPGTANESTPLPPCQACGIKPPLVHVVKVAIASLSKRHPERASDVLLEGSAGGDVSSGSSFRCPRCTFENHPSLLACEMCGTALVSGPTHHLSSELSRSSSPGVTQVDSAQSIDSKEGVKFSFRGGGEKIFHERLKGALVQRKWLLQSAPPVPKAESQTANASAFANRNRSRVGIAGLERRGEELRKNNETVIGNAFEDLAALMASAKEIIALAENFASQTNNHTSPDGSTDQEGNLASNDATALLSQLNLTTTKDMLSSSNSAANSKENSASLYHRELSRSLAEFLTDDARGALRRSGGIISLVDLWAVFNRSRGGVELVSPNDFAMAAELLSELSLPIRLRRFKSGLLVVQEKGRTDEKTTKALMLWFQDLRDEIMEHERLLSSGIGDDETQVWGRGVTAQETAEKFGWSVGVASEELEMAEERGALCREMSFEGTKFWENWLVKAAPSVF